MPKSDRFLQLENRLHILQHHFLPPEFSATGIYDERTVDHARAFILLAHAEIESYLEDRARDKVNRARKRWKARRLCSALISRLLVYHSARNAKAVGWNPTLPSDEAVEKAVKFYLYELRQNHGIKEQNVLSILMPLGVSYRNLNTTLVGTLDSFGGVRGKLAHLSIKAHQSIDPKTVSDDIWVNIMPDLEQLDESLSKLR